MKPPIDILHLFPVLNNHLVDFLKRLKEDDWQKPTVAKLWRIKDVVAHLVDGNYRQLAVKRDGWTPPPDAAINSYTDLVNYLNRYNADWVKAARRLSPRLLIEMLEDTNEKVYKVYQDMNPFGQAVYSVGWAGESVSYNWFDMAREYTERWLHQQQIRNAVNDRGIMTKDLYHPVLDIFMRAWPHTCQDAKADTGTILKTTITGEGGGEWFLLKNADHWKLSDIAGDMIAAETTIDGDMAWILFTKSIRKEDMKSGYEIKGNTQLGEKVLDMVSVMA